MTYWQKSYFKLFGLLACMGGFISPVYGDDYTCPNEIAYIEGDPLAKTALEPITQIYDALGCEISLQPRPGLRSIFDFNHDNIDGELYRLEFIEEAYEREFTRSKLPLFSLRNSLWIHEDKANLDSVKVGYVLGIQWHKKIVFENRPENVLFLTFDTEETMHLAYEYGKIDGFLSEKQTVMLLMDTGVISRTPLERLNFGTQDLYHYLRSDFEPFMQEFSNYLEKQNPYQHMN